MVELTFIAALVGCFVACVVTGMWAGTAMVFGFPMPDQDQVVGLMLVGGCGLPIVGWIVALLNP